MRSFPWINLASLVLLLLSGLLWSGVFFASAQGDTESLDTYCEGYKYNKDQLFEDIFEEASVNSSIQIADMFSGNSEKPKIENLYLNIYKMLDQSPNNEALQSTAAQYQYTQTEMCGILGGGLFLLTDTSDNTLSVTELQDLRAEILSTYEKELEKSKREQEMFLDSYGKEIFANGDTGDSSFDVLYDLEVLEYLLFGEDTYSTTGGGDLNFSSDDDSEEDGASDSTEDSDSEGSSSSGSSSTSGSTEESEDTDTESTPDEPDAEEDESFTAASCVEDTVLQVVLQETLGTDDAEEGDAETVDSGDDDGTGADDSGTDDTRDAGSESPTDTSSSPTDLIVASTPHDWTQPQICDGIFCLFINFINEDETEYSSSDNCVQCHVDYILEAMKETTSKDLTPGKVSGNLLEPAVCKRSLVEKLIRPAGLTFIAIPMPIQTPPADDIVTGLNFCEKNRDLVDGENNADLLLSAIFKEKCGEDSDIPTELTEEENARLQNFGEGLNDEIKAANTRAYGESSLQDLLAEALPANEANQRALEENFQNSRIESQFSDQASFYTLMDYEMTQMNAYFEIFQTLIGNTQTIAEELKNRLQSAQ